MKFRHERIPFLLITIVLLILILASCSCSTDIITETETITITPALPTYSINTNTIDGSVGIVLYEDNVPGDGIYTYSKVKNSSYPNGAVELRVLLEGEALSDFPGEQWPFAAPALIPGKVLVVFGYLEYGDPYVFINPGETLTYIFGDNDDSSTDVYFYSEGYVVWKFEDVSADSDELIRLPDATLQPVADKWVFYPTS
jgi:hypothetical protein